MHVSTHSTNLKLSVPVSATTTITSTQKHHHHHQHQNQNHNHHQISSLEDTRGGQKLSLTYRSAANTANSKITTSLPSSSIECDTEDEVCIINEIVIIKCKLM